MTPYSLVTLLVATQFLLISGFALKSGVPLFRSIGLLACCTGLWQLSWTVLFNTSDPRLALVLARLGHIPILALPVIILDFITRYTGRPTRIFWPALVSCASLMLFNATSGAIVSGVRPLFFGFYPVAGAVHWGLLAVIAVAYIDVCIRLAAYLRAAPRTRKSDRLLTIGILVYPFASVDFLVNYGFVFYPFGFVFVTTFVASAIAAAMLWMLEEVKALNSSLEDRIAAAVTTIEAQRDALVQSSKLAAIGTTAAGVAHEINNPLNFLIPMMNRFWQTSEALLRIDELVEKLPVDSPRLQELRQTGRIQKFRGDFEYLRRTSLSLIHRIKDITTSLTIFARDSANQKRDPFFVNALLSDSVRSVREGLRYRDEVEIRLELGEDWELVGDAGQMSQVITNLLNNALDAITGPGRIEVRSSVDKDKRVIQIVDTGSGISDDTLKRMFEPFFTTKGPGKGTGLGLAISKEIVGHHSGDLTVASKVGEGTTFSIQFSAGPHKPGGG